MPDPIPMEETLWKIVSGSPSPEELAAVTVVLTLLFRHAGTATAPPPPVIPLAHWRHTPTPDTGTSWRTPERLAS
ncbi:acyl-CoA carboxylase subunit epsilon [Streptomyces sp. enrichment culture]|uniref:acyl-CoA carboxylase subunit epsilon n=1 Tax=Streptomyces sp. enrichment culture TaxID=1795815 RepID=UPI003F56C346